MLVDPIDTFVAYIKQQLTAASATVTINGVSGPQRVAQVIEARDWPLTAPVEGALYLLVQSPRQVGGTQSQNLFEYMCQWTWLVIGQDIQAAQQGSNRGSRYRTNMQIMSNLRQAHYPGFCQKNSVTVDQQTGVLTYTPVASVVPVSAPEMIWWGKLRYAPRQDNDKSGLLYGVAVFSIFDYQDVLAAIA